MLTTDELRAIRDKVQSQCEERRAAFEQTWGALQMLNDLVSLAEQGDAATKEAEDVSQGSPA